LDVLSKAIVGCNLIDGTGKFPIKEATILIEGSKIIDVGKGIDFPSNAEVIDAAGKTVMPGLIDAHTHLGSPHMPPGTDQSAIQDALTTIRTANSPIVAMFMLKSAQQNLDAGFTTVKDISWVWDPLGVQGIAVRNAINNGWFIGPRIVVFSWIGMTGGHCDLRLWHYPSTNPNLARIGGPLVWPADQVADGVGEVLKRCRQALRFGADGLKTSADSYELWGRSSATAKLYKNYSLEELKAMCDEAHRHHRLVSMHSHSPYGIKHAIDGGANVIEHCSRPDDEGIAMILKGKITTTATLMGRGPIEATFDKKSPRYELRLIGRDFFMKKYKKGVPMAMGTDTCHGGHRQGLAARGIAMMVEYGMSPMDAIVSTTKIGAEACNLGDQLGTLEKGKLADIIMVDGDPLKNIQVLMDKENIEIVMKGGEVLVDRRSKI